MRTVGASFGGCAVVVGLFNLFIGTWTFSYDLWIIFGKQAPLLIDAICGLILGEVTVPLAMVLWLLNVGGVHFAH